MYAIRSYYAVGLPGPYSPANFSTTSQRPERDREKTLGFVVAAVRFRRENTATEMKVFFASGRRTGGRSGKGDEEHLAETKLMDEIFVCHLIRHTYKKWNHEPLNSPEVTVMQGSPV